LTHGPRFSHALGLTWSGAFLFPLPAKRAANGTARAEPAESSIRRTIRVYPKRYMGEGFHVERRGARGCPRGGASGRSGRLRADLRRTRPLPRIRS